MKGKKALTVLVILGLIKIALLVPRAVAQEPEAAAKEPGVVAKEEYSQQVLTRLNVGSVNMFTGLGKIVTEVPKFTVPVSGSEGITNFQHLIGGVLSGTMEAAETISIGAMDTFLFFAPSKPVSGSEYWFKGVKWPSGPQGQQFSFQYMMDKLNVGSVNAITGMGKLGPEIFRQTRAEGHDQVTGFLGGLVSGTTQGIKTMALGIVDLSLFFMPTIPVSNSQYWWVSSKK